MQNHGKVSQETKGIVPALTENGMQPGHKPF